MGSYDDWKLVSGDDYYDDEEFDDEDDFHYEDDYYYTDEIVKRSTDNEH